MISVIVPVYNVEPYLRQCIDSILGQTYMDIEVLLIDDGSQDRCGKICDEYAKKDARVKVYHTENRGLSAARNLGLKEARGDYIGFVDSDDWIEPDMCEILLKRIQETGADISVCGLWYEHENNNRQASYPNEEIYVGDQAVKALISKQLNVYVWNKLYYRKAWDGISFPEGHVFEDVATTYKVLLNARKVAVVSRTSYHYRQRKGSICSTHSMQNLLDYWDAYYSQYEAIKTTKLLDDSIIAERLLQDVANSALRVWRWVFAVPSNERDDKQLKRIASYVRENYSALGEKDWPFYLRCGIAFVRYANPLAYLTAYYINQLYRIYRFSSRRSLRSKLIHCKSSKRSLFLPESTEGIAAGQTTAMAQDIADCDKMDTIYSDIEENEEKTVQNR